ncbi:glycoside hydrolase family 13 protein [Aurantimicrobium sp. MWH-Uga1]|uniref:glycoside hydrolase family 13 protein n=1 Tax=Aurantimicrobium sp. MWH-Uga1 TaxID=2079575 RepID=UPI000DED8E10|nr:glycoside hydrolase family 13 protein [Aurantimicrobium sp. MWH-Uga1]AXE55122.1 Oligo-1,6-glucosidase [Aurantimicrobium sp. MWH-Uga1]
MVENQWWRSSVVYQIYPRSFADSNGDGIGDLPGITARLPKLKELGVDAIWLSPFMTSPQKDAGYDVANYCDVDPLFGTLADFDALEARAHSLGLKVIVDLVPNHCSSEHPWFIEALAAGAGSTERARFMFREGKGENGELPPNNWESVFGGPAWTRTTNPDGTPGQWYLHLFDSSQPDFDWTNPWVRERFIEILKFWLDRGVDGFRVDVAHGLSKAPGLPDFRRDEEYWNTPPQERIDNPYFGHDGVHEIYREWNKVLAEYPGERILCAEAFVEPLTKMALWVRPDEMQQAFNFPFLVTRWNGEQMRQVIKDSISAFAAVGAPSTWVLSNHDQVRHATRLALNPATSTADRITGIGPLTEPKPDPALGLARARAASVMMLALPGVAYLYQGEELGLPEAVDIPDDKRQDPTFFRTAGESYGRDGCRVPLPWEAEEINLGFGPAGEPWLPQPEVYREYSRDLEEADPHSTLALYKSALTSRKQHDLGEGELEWIEGTPENILGFRNKDVTVFTNYSEEDFALPAGKIILDSADSSDGILRPATAVWMV